MSARKHEEVDIERLTDDNSPDATIIIGEFRHDITMNEVEIQNATKLR